MEADIGRRAGLSKEMSPGNSSPTTVSLKNGLYTKSSESILLNTSYKLEMNIQKVSS